MTRDSHCHELPRGQKLDNGLLTTKMAECQLATRYAETNYIYVYSSFLKRTALQDCVPRTQHLRLLSSSHTYNFHCVPRTV